MASIIDNDVKRFSRILFIWKKTCQVFQLSFAGYVFEKGLMHDEDSAHD
jgi:hypothetical protein